MRFIAILAGLTQALFMLYDIRLFINIIEYFAVAI